MQTGIPNALEEKPITTQNLTPREEISRFPIRKSVAHAPKNAPIFTLPIKILDDIFAYLPKSSVVAFTLTSHKLKTSLGPEHWTEILDVVKTSPKETTDLLDLLCRDCEQYISCHTCLKLHEPSASTTARKCWEHDKKNGVETIIHEQFRFSEIQMTAKLYHEGKYKSSQLQLRSIGRTGDQLINYHRHQLNDPCVTHQFRMNSQARIIYRSQHVYLVPHNLPDSFSECRSAISKFISRGYPNSLHNDYRRIFHRKQWLDPIPICVHMGPLCRVRHWSSLSCFGQSFVQWNCTICGTGFQDDIVGFGSEGLAFVVTKWMDLRRGLNQDQEWERNFDLQGVPRHPGMFAMGSNGPISRWWEDIEGESRYVPTLSKAQEKILGIPIRKGTYDPEQSWFRPTGLFSVECIKNI
ncbi:hypothetical protein BHYA_0263g00020 [Botrytis hyacinthi]|uniref:F-box domain-containing protein n=1 Tax=Botrytis hyacinthi TaxID=278943 RepID=A0A4Z1GGR6_9HELO|nr:hypothetical protein BHYA_0263g00020 [Botrytis hyacinthi]